MTVVVRELHDVKWLWRQKRRKCKMWTDQVISGRALRQPYRRPPGLPIRHNKDLKSGGSRGLNLKD